jgi:biopolymer transport protein TolQ
VDRSVTATDLGGAMHDLSLWGLFLQADWVVKLVMLGLLVASVWVWAIVFEKVTSLRRANRAADAFEDSFWSGGSLDELYRKEGDQPSHPMAAVFASAMREWRRGAQRLGGSDLVAAGLKERIDRTMAVTVQREMERLERWMVFLASVGSAAPFIGLFGTVWGIYHALISISAAGTITIERVSGPVGEALVMTAAGLAVAIPAVLAYNIFGKRVSASEAELEGFAHDLREMIIDTGRGA